MEYKRQKVSQMTAEQEIVLQQIFEMIEMQKLLTHDIESKLERLTVLIMEGSPF